MQEWQINNGNCKEAAKWLLQCDHEDFNGSLSQIEQWFEALEEAYQCQKHNLSPESNRGLVEKIQLKMWSRLLYQYLNYSAKIQLIQRIENTEKKKAL